MPYYAAKVDNETRVFTQWKDCQSFTSGKFSRFKKFTTESEAYDWLESLNGKKADKKVKPTDNSKFKLKSDILDYGCTNEFLEKLSIAEDMLKNNNADMETLFSIYETRKLLDQIKQNVNFVNGKLSAIKGEINDRVSSQTPTPQEARSMNEMYDSWAEGICLDDDEDMPF